MISAQVVGEYCKGIKHAVTPAMRNALKNQLYDSTVDNVNDPSIFVTYHDAQAYPESARGGGDHYGASMASGVGVGVDAP